MNTIILHLLYNDQIFGLYLTQKFFVEFFLVFALLNINFKSVCQVYRQIWYILIYQIYIRINGQHSVRHLMPHNPFLAILINQSPRFTTHLRYFEQISAIQTVEDCELTPFSRH